MLNSGEVPNLFEKDELEKVLAATRPKAKEAGINEGNRDEVGLTYGISTIHISGEDKVYIQARACVCVCVCVGVPVLYPACA